MAGRHVGTTTSDGVLVDERMVEPGDWTGPGGAHQILARRDIDVAVLETARGGIVLRGVGYESNEASVLTNVSSDHLDLQGIHTLPELAEVKSTICRITKPDGWVVLNADDPLVAAVARRVRAQVALFTLDGDGSAVVAPPSRARRAGLPRRATASLVEAERRRARRASSRSAGSRSRSAGWPATTSPTRSRRPAGRAAWARRSPRSATACSTSGRRRSGRRAGSTCSGSGAGSSSSTSPTTRRASAPSSTWPRGSPPGRPGGRRRSPRSSGPPATGRTTRSAASGGSPPSGRSGSRSSRRSSYLRGRTAESVVGELLAGVVAGGGDATDVPIYDSETEALRAELNGAAGHGSNGGRADAARVIVLMCHEDRDGVFELLASLGARPVDVASELTELVPRLQGRPAAGLTATPPQAAGSRRGHHATTSSRAREQQVRRLVREREPVGGGHRVALDLGLGRLERPGSRGGSRSRRAARPASTANRPRRSVRNASSEPGAAGSTGPVGPVAGLEPRRRPALIRPLRAVVDPAARACPTDIRAWKYGRWNAGRAPSTAEPAPASRLRNQTPASAARAGRRSGR